MRCCVVTHYIDLGKLKIVEVADIFGELTHSPAHIQDQVIMSDQCFKGEGIWGKIGGQQPFNRFDNAALPQYLFNLPPITPLRNAGSRIKIVAQ